MKCRSTCCQGLPMRTSTGCNSFRKYSSVLSLGRQGIRPTPDTPSIALNNHSLASTPTNTPSKATPLSPEDECDPAEELSSECTQVPHDSEDVSDIAEESSAEGIQASNESEDISDVAKQLWNVFCLVYSKESKNQRHSIRSLPPSPPKWLIWGG